MYLSKVIVTILLNIFSHVESELYPAQVRVDMLKPETELKPVQEPRYDNKDVNKY